MNRLIICIFGVILLAGCGSTPKKSEPLPEPVTLSEQLTLEDVCNYVKVETYKAGLAKSAGIRKKIYLRTLESSFPVQLLPDVHQSIETVYSLPIKTSGDSNAYANLVYKQCILNNK